MNDFQKDDQGNPIIILGEKYRDMVHGFEGVATVLSRHMTGCDRVCLEAMDDKSDLKEYWFDITRLEDVKIPASEQKTGGPQSAPPSRNRSA